MLTDEQLIRSVRAALERESSGIAPPPDLLASIHEELRSSPAAKRHWWRGSSRGVHLRLAHLTPVAALLVVVAVVAVFLGIQSRHPRGSAAAHHPSGSALARHGVTLVFLAEPTAQTPRVTRAALQRAVNTMKQRVNQLGVSGAQISLRGANFISVRLPDVQNTKRAEQLVGTTARLEFYDWEANALTPDGKPVASELSTKNPQALEISQGNSVPPGSPGAGSLELYQAVKLAANQPAQLRSPSLSRLGSEYFAFGAPSSPACAAASRAYHTTPVIGQQCYLAGPQDNLSDLRASIPSGVSSSSNAVRTLAVPEGWVVLQAVPSGGFSHVLPWSNPSAQYYVLRDHVSLFGNDITNPQQSTDQSGSPDVTFGFTSKGANALQNVTAAIAHRGAVVSGFGQQLNQHFAVALDTQLITVPSIDFKTYPDGITGGGGADIAGSFTKGSARDLAAQLRLGALPINLKLIARVPSR